MSTWKPIHFAGLIIIAAACYSLILTGSGWAVLGLAAGLIMTLASD